MSKHTYQQTLNCVIPRDRIKLPTQVVYLHKIYPVVGVVRGDGIHSVYDVLVEGLSRIPLSLNFIDRNKGNGFIYN